MDFCLYVSAYGYFVLFASACQCLRNGVSSNPTSTFAITPYAVTVAYGIGYAIAPIVPPAVYAPVIIYMFS